MGLTDEYRLEVLSPEGTFRFYRQLEMGPDELRLDGGPRRMEVRGNGDCREATFEGDPVSLGIGPRDIVTVQFRSGPNAIWRNRYAGVAVVNGSADSEIGRYKLQGFRMKRLTEVEVRGTLPEMDLGAQVRELFLQLNASGQLGIDGQIGPILIRPDEPNIPDLDITSAAIDGNFWSVAKLIDERLKGRSRRSQVYLNADGSTESRDENPDWGVNADRRPVFGYPTGLLEIDEAGELVEIDGLDVDSTALVTDVRLIWARTLQAGAVYSLLSSTGNLRDATRYAEDLARAGPLTREVPVAPHTYGQAWRSVAVPANAELFQPLEAPTVGVSVATALYPDGVPPGTPSVTGDSPLLADGKPDTAIEISAPPGALAVTYSLTLDYPDTTPLPDGFVLAVEGGSVERVTISGQAGDDLVLLTVERPNTTAGGLNLFPWKLRDGRLRDRWSVGKRLSFTVSQASVATPLRISAAALIQADAELMLATAGPLARLPIQNPATVRLPGWDTDPAPKIRILRRDLAGNLTGTRELPVDLFVYDVDEDGELYTEVRCGQSDDAEKLSFAAAITAKDQTATLDAVRAV
ncbi:hypothetical protein [Deinococcus marmoris]|uniref:Uncharacterized protein n=1 Tax=Deinococcus marmoris TaxID=249408 RepID=A0A1U7P4M4_9DEIO|nr:hypothetical protein [Deinococcus marmoris]OLV20110.1 hypothetical protein BOO71_0000358 [Deinococcus marmoris]